VVTLNIPLSSFCKGQWFGQEVGDENDLLVDFDGFEPRSAPASSGNLTECPRSCQEKYCGG